jgi:hypothetical protein
MVLSGDGVGVGDGARSAVQKLRMSLRLPPVSDVD